MTVDQSSVTVEGQAGSEFVLPWFYDVTFQTDGNDHTQLGNIAVQPLVTLIGAGFASGLNCKAQASGGSSSFPLTISTSAASNATHLTMAIAASQLTPDDYTIMCSFSNTYPASTATLKVYNKQAIAATSISHSEFDIAANSEETVTITANANTLNLGPLYCVTEDGIRPKDGEPGHRAERQLGVAYNTDDLLGQAFALTANSPAPVPTAKFVNSGGQITITLNRRAVLTRGVTNCGDLFTGGSSVLGSTATCIINSLTRIIIRNPTIPIADVQQGRLGQCRGTVPRQPINPITPKIRLRGKKKIGACATSFTVNAKRSGGLGGRDGTYTWSASPSAGLTITGTSTQQITVSSLTAGTTYTVTLQLCNFLGVCSTLSRDVTQKAALAPDVEIETLADVTQVKPSERFDLVAKARLYKGCADDDVVFTWSFDRSFTYNADYESRASFTVEPYVLPAPDTITATVRASLKNNTSVYNEDSIEITVLSSLESRVDGGEEVTVGVSQGTFDLDATTSTDPDGLTGAMEYEWTCEAEESDGTVTTCLDQSGSVMPSAGQKTQGVLSLSAAELEADTAYRFTSTISKKSGGTTRFATSTVTVTATAGDPPKIKLDLVNDQRGKYNLEDKVTIAAKIFSTSAPSLPWETISETGFGYVNLNDTDYVYKQQEPNLVDAATNKYISFLSVRPDKLDRGTWYKFGCTVTDANGQESRASVKFYIYSGVSACQLDIAGGSYTALGPVPSSTGSLDISYGPKAFLTTSNVFAVKVCARKGGCQNFYSSPVSVLQITATVINSLKGTIMDDANDLKKAGDPMAGLILLKNLLLANLSISRRKQSADPVTPEINSLMLDFVNNTLTSVFPSQEVLETLIEVLDTIPLTSLSNDDALRKLSLLEQILTGFEDSSTKMKPEYVESVKQFATSAMNDRAMGSSQFSSMSTTLKKASRKSLSFGTADEMSTGNSKMTYLVDVPGSAQASKSTSDAITVDFGTELTNTYSSWSCRSSSCLGVGIEMNHYDTTEDPYSTDTDRLSDVIDLNLFNPDSVL
ncbi:hypothetical protein ACOMHN_043438 [Nucella lapillus]